MTYPIRYAGLGYPAAVQAADGSWSIGAPTSQYTGEWGSFRIEAGATWDTYGTAFAAAGSVAVKTAAGTDITEWNGAPTFIDSLSFGEPYGETTGQITLPAVPIFDYPAWLFAGMNIDIWRVLPAALAATTGTAEIPYWHGMVASVEWADGPGIETSTTLQLVGALYGEASVRTHQPLMVDTVNDAGTWFGRALSPRLYTRPIPYFTHFSFESTTTDSPSNPDGILTRFRGTRGQTVLDYCDELLALTQDNYNTWTISRAFQAMGTPAIAVPRARHYYLRRKATYMGDGVQENTISAGGYGVALSVSYSYTDAETAIYGEGVNPVDSSELSGSRWRNAKYPMLAGTVPTYPTRISGSTYPIQVNDYDADFSNSYDVITTLNAQLRAGGWPYVTIGSAFTAATGEAIRALKNDVDWANEQPSVGGTAEWSMIFGDNSSSAGDLDSGYFAPLAVADNQVEPYLYSSFGEVIGDNPTFDPDLLRVDRMISYGDNISKGDARANARRLVKGGSQYAFTGTISLTTDTVDETVPAGRSRLDLREGGWVQVNGQGGIDQDYYMAGITHTNLTGIGDMTTTVTVSTLPFDLLDVQTRIERDRAARDNPAKSFYSQRNRSVRPFRQVTGWDAESGAGLIRATATAGSAWTVGRVLGAQYGGIGSMKITHKPATGYCFAVFGGSVSAAALGSAITNPLGSVTGDYPSWWQHPDNLDFLDSVGFIEAWGDVSEHAGYYPGAYSIGGTAGAGTATGKLEDAGSWQFASLEPPWLYYAIWPKTAGTVSGQMRIVVDE